MKILALLLPALLLGTWPCTAGELFDAPPGWERYPSGYYSPTEAYSSPAQQELYPTNQRHLYIGIYKEEPIFSLKQAKAEPSPRYEHWHGMLFVDSTVDTTIRGYPARYRRSYSKDDEFYLHDTYCIFTDTAMLEVIISFDSRYFTREEATALLERLKIPGNPVELEDLARAPHWTRDFNPFVLVYGTGFLTIAGLLFICYLIARDPKRRRAQRGATD